MNNSKKVNISLLIGIIIGLSSYFFSNKDFVNKTYLKLYVFLGPSPDQKAFIKKYIFPYRLIDNLSESNSKLYKTIKSLSPLLAELEVYKKNSGTDIETVKSTIKLLEPNLTILNNVNLEKYKLTSGFYSGIYQDFPGTGYIDFNADDLIIVSSKGLLAFSEDFPSNEVNFKQIKNNIDEFINLKQFKISQKFSIKDLLIFKDNIYISYSEEISSNCWNTSVLSGKLNYENLNFKKLFSSKECIHEEKNVDGEFQAVQAGGRLVPFDDSNIIFSTGDYRSRYLAQDINSVNGKLIKINLKNGEYKIISMGHRNPQGLYLDKENNFLLSTEHGPKGGDEINILTGINKKRSEVYNFGWPIASAGEHYGGRIEKNKKKYEKYPLHKSHSKYGFLEPLKSFVPSIGISEIVKINKGNYAVSSLKDKSLYFFTLTDEGLMKNLKRLEVGERIRDLKLKNNYLYMLLEDTPSIGVLNFN